LVILIQFLNEKKCLSLKLIYDSPSLASSS